MSHHKLEVKNVQYSYPDGHKAIKEMNFTLTHGESVGIVGANGAGKSTLLMLLMGILFPTKGEIIIGDVPVTKKTLPLIRKSVGMVFQDPEDQLFMPTVYDDIAFGPRNYMLEEKAVETLVLKAMDMVGITHLRDRPPFKLSGGEKRAAAIATVLAMEPDILVMDEPTAALDPKARRRVMSYLRNFKHTKLITSHDLDMVFDLCDRTIVIKEGIIAADGPTLKILTDAQFMDDCGLEVPFSIQSCPVCGKNKYGD